MGASCQCVVEVPCSGGIRLVEETAVSEVEPLVRAVVAIDDTVVNTGPAGDVLRSVGA